MSKIYHHRVFSYNFGGLQKVLNSIDRNIRLESVVPYNMYEGVAVLSEDIADDPVSDLAKSDPEATSAAVKSAPKALNHRKEI